MLDIGGYSLQLWVLILTAGSFSLLYFFLYRKHIISIFDPLNVFIISQIASCIMAVFLIEQTSMLIQFFAAQIAFYIGFNLNKAPKPMGGTINWNGRELQTLELVVGILFIVWLAANIYMGLTAGFPLFSNDPSLAKTEVYNGGLGFIKRLNGGVGVFVPTGCIFLALKGRHKRAFTTIFLAAMFLSVLGGGKGAMLSFLYIFAYVLYRRDFVPPASASRLKGISKWTAVGAVGLSLFVLSASGNNLSIVFQLLAKRILFYGDVIIFYYHQEVINYFSTLGPVDYVTAMLNPILGAFRIVKYQEPLGYLMVLQNLGPNETLASVTGPNNQYYVLSHIYFGSLFGTLYCGVIGFCVSRVRRWFFEAQRKTALQMTSILTMAIIIFALPVEAPMFISMLFDTFVPVSLITGVVYVALSAAEYGHRSI